VKFGLVVFEIRQQTDTPTDRHTDAFVAILRTPTGGEANIYMRVPRDWETFVYTDTDTGPILITI